MARPRAPSSLFQILCGLRLHCRCIVLSPVISFDAGSVYDERFLSTSAHSRAVMLLAPRLGEPISEPALSQSESAALLYITSQTLHDVATLSKDPGAESE
jgi:hypothetical protein